MTDGAFYSGNLPFSKHQSADRPNFVRGIQTPKSAKNEVSSIKFEPMKQF
jgi:hypothetical protein